MSLSLSHAIIAFDVALIAAFVLDFALVSRTNDSVVGKWPALVMCMVLLGGTAAMPDGRLSFLACGLLVLGAALFGYANFLAFVKRGVTFSILSNHTQPPQSRLADHAFIAIEDRLHEMRRHGWAIERNGRWELTAAGHRVARIRQWLLTVLNIEAVG